MKTFSLIAALCGLAACVAAPELSVSTIAGSYAHREGSGAFEEFALNDDGSFQSWLHERPDLFGSWSLDGANITVHGDDDTTQLITIKAHSARELVLEFEGMEGEGVYARL